jgi:hypothetical protein
MPEQPREPIQVVVLPQQLRSLRSWLITQGWELFRIPSDDDDLPTYGIRATEEAMSGA